MNDMMPTNKNKNNIYQTEGNLFFCVPKNTRDSSLKFWISHSVVVELNRDMTKMMDLMTNSILEGLLSGRK